MLPSPAYLTVSVSLTVSAVPLSAAILKPFSFRSCSWPPLMASLLPAAMLPSATPVILLPPLFKPSLVRLTGLPETGVIVTPPALVTVLLPAASWVVTLAKVGASFMLTVTVVLPVAAS